MSAKWIRAKGGVLNFKVPRSGYREGFVMREPWSGFYVAHVFREGGLTAFVEASR